VVISVEGVYFLITRRLSFHKKGGSSSRHLFSVTETPRKREVNKHAKKDLSAQKVKMRPTLLTYKGRKQHLRRRKKKYREGGRSFVHAGDWRGRGGA